MNQPGLLRAVTTPSTLSRIRMTRSPTAGAEAAGTGAGAAGAGGGAAGAGAGAAGAGAGAAAGVDTSMGAARSTPRARSGVFLSDSVLLACVASQTGGPGGSGRGTGDPAT